MKSLLSFVLITLVFAATDAANSAPPLPPIVIEDFRLVGDLITDHASFTLTATARVENSKGATLDLLSGAVALTEVGGGKNSQWRVRALPGRFALVFDHSGKFPIQLKFDAAVKQEDPWKTVEFRVAPSALQQIVLHGLSADTQFKFAGAARPDRKGSDFVSYLPTDGAVNLSWKQAPPETEGKLFYAVEMLSQISVSPGLMRQVSLLDYKIMQGELSRVTLLLHGAGEVTRVQGDSVLAWNVEPLSETNITTKPLTPALSPSEGERENRRPADTVPDRVLVVQFNQPQKDRFFIQVQTQTPLGAFPQMAEVMQLKPDRATRFAGYFRIVNEGAVRLEVLQASGLSQISPDQFPESDVTKAMFRAGGSQRFAYRFSGGDLALSIQADQILPELGVSELLAYNLGENDLAIDAEFELDIREAPLRELLIRMPKGYVLARLSAPGMSDYFVRDAEDTNSPTGTSALPGAELRLVYGQPVSGRQVVQLRLERNKSLGETSWSLPRIEIAKAKSVRGHVGVSADAGFRLTPERTQNLTELATAFFPRKLANIQAAFRLNDPAWLAALRVERLPQTVQADAFHLFSIGEGIAYGSSVINYQVSGAPVSAFKIELSGEYFNVEFSGKDVRNWQKIEGGYLVQLHTPVSGAYTLLATYERPFKAQGETLGFTGARPLDAQSEQGHTLIISAYQFQVKPEDVSAGLLPLEPAEVPSEYRLFFDAPILAAYRYSARPFNLKLALSPLAQGESLSQIVDRASLTTRISKEGQVLTDARYFVKSRGNSHFRLSLPMGAELWSALVNGVAVVPVTDGQDNLIPLPTRADPNAVLTLDLKLAATSSVPTTVTVAAPKLHAPVMLTEWKVEPDTNQRLIYRQGSLTPVGGVRDISGFAGVAEMLNGTEANSATRAMAAFLGFMVAALVCWRWASGAGSRRFTTRHLVGTGLGAVAVFIAGVAWTNLNSAALREYGAVPKDVTFLAPVQQPVQSGGGLTIEVANVVDKVTVREFVSFAWPALAGVVAWAYGWLTRKPWLRRAGWISGWLLAAWAALRCPNGAQAFVLVVGVFLLAHVVVPALIALWRVPPQPEPEPAGETASGSAPAAAAMLIGGLVWLSWVSAGHAEISNFKSADFKSDPPLAESVTNDLRVEDKFVMGTAKIRWQAEKGQVLPLLFEPAVLTRLNYPANAFKLVQEPLIGPVGPVSNKLERVHAEISSKAIHQLIAQKSGEFDIEVQYQLQVTKRGEETGLLLPVRYGVINRLKVAVVNLDVDVLSPEAISVQRESVGSNTVASLSLAPAGETWIAWKPRSRDVKREKAVFYAEVSQLYAPAAGLISGVHHVFVRPAQGELNEMVMDVPAGATISDVSDASDLSKKTGSIVSLWRFDPDARKLRVSLNPPQSRPFALLVRSQVATGPLPLEQTVGLLSVENAAGQIGVLGVATGNEVQLDKVGAEAFSPINLEDFPADLAALLQPGLTIRRAFRYSDATATAKLTASAVEPDVRVESQNTLSLGEDRTVLASELTVDITRAGIFRLSFVMPPGYDVETITGQVLSHWTELKTDAGRVITLHLTGKTEGQKQFSISLAGPGVKATNGWPAPQLVLREASKQRGTLLIVPEQGMRLQLGPHDGVTQLDPQKAGIRQKGVLAFRLLQTPWTVALGIEQVEPWVQVTSLQHAAVNEAQVKVTANLQYQIDNTGLKAFRLFIPTNSEGVRFAGDQVADFLQVPGSVTNGLQEWEIKLHRRVIGPYLLQATYQIPLGERSQEAMVRGVQAAGVNLQRGFVTVETAGRLQATVDALPAALQPTEWQSIPRALQRDLQTASANFAYRLVEPAFQLPLKLQRHEAAKLLEARVNNVTFSSVISDDGVVLTQVRLEMLPADKRLLNVTLPAGASFWFAFVNQNGVWPWREQDRILIPLEQPQARGGQAIPVELFYSSKLGSANPSALDLELIAPKFDLPLENITWRVSLSDKWQIKNWTGSLQLQHQEVVPQMAATDLNGYLRTEEAMKQQRTKAAEDYLAAGNAALQQGDPQQARRSFQAAYSLSGHDAAFNEDARVQLHNIKLQEALVGLNVRQAAAAGDTGTIGGKLRDLRNRKEAAYTQQDAKDIIDRNTADDNAAYMKLAERIIQQQDAAVSSPAALRANIPVEGRVLTFTRAVEVEKRADLKLALAASAARAASEGTRVLILAATAAVLVGFGWMGMGALRREPNVA